MLLPWMEAVMLASARLSYLKKRRLSDCREEGFLEIDLAGIGLSFSSLALSRGGLHPAEAQPASSRSGPRTKQLLARMQLMELLGAC